MIYFLIMDGTFIFFDFCYISVKIFEILNLLH